MDRLVRYLTDAVKKTVPFPQVRLEASPLGPTCSLLVVNDKQVHVRVYNGELFLYRNNAEGWQRRSLAKRTRGREHARMLLNEIVNGEELARQRAASLARIQEAATARRAAVEAATAQRAAKTQHFKQAFDKLVERFGVYENEVRFLADEYGAHLVLGVRLSPVQAEKVLAALVDAKVLYTRKNVPIEPGGG